MLAVAVVQKWPFRKCFQINNRECKDRWPEQFFVGDTVGLLGSLQNYFGDGNENVRKQIINRFSQLAKLISFNLI